MTKDSFLFAEICKLWSAHTKSLQENRLLKTEKVEKNKHFKADNFKIGQLVAVKNHLRNTSEPKFVSDYRILKIVNEHTLLIKSPDGKTPHQTNINDAKPVSATTATDNAIQDFKQSATKKSILTCTCCKALLSKYIKQSSNQCNLEKKK